MTFNPYKHLRLAGALVHVLGFCLRSIALVGFGMTLLVVGIVGGRDVTERRVEESEERNAKAETSESH